MQKNPNGLFIANLDVYAGSTPAKHEYAQLSRDGELVTNTILNDPDSARQQRGVGVPYVVYRQSEWEPDVPRNITRKEIKELAEGIYQAAKNLRVRVGDPNIHIMVNCEQDPHPARYTLYVELMECAMRDLMGPVGMVFSNVATGVLKSGQRGEINDWSHPARLEYILTLDKYRHIRLASGSYAFIHGTHGYTALYPWIAVNGGQHRVHNWTEGDKFLDGREHINWSLPQDHLGREFQGMMLALGYLWLDALRRWIPSSQSKVPLRPDGTMVEPPWFIVTEQLIDAMNDVRWIHRADMTFTEEFPEPIGYRTLAETWKRKDWFPTVNALHTLADFIKWTWQVVYEPVGYCIGTHYYASGATGAETRTHNVSPQGRLEQDFFLHVKSYRRPMPDHFFKNVPYVPPIFDIPTSPEPPEPSPVVDPPVTDANKVVIAEALFMLDEAQAKIISARARLRSLT